VTISTFVHREPFSSREGLDARIVEGSAITDKRSLLGEMATALDFPAYFGYNWDAFEECLRDAPKFNAPGALTVVLRDSENVRRQLPEEFEMLLRIWADTTPTSAREGLQMHLVVA